MRPSPGAHRIGSSGRQTTGMQLLVVTSAATKGHPSVSGGRSGRSRSCSIAGGRGFVASAMQHMPCSPMVHDLFDLKDCDGVPTHRGVHALTTVSWTRRVDRWPTGSKLAPHPRNALVGILEALSMGCALLRPHAAGRRSLASSD